MSNLKILELTKENESEYLDKLANLEKLVLNHMIKNGKEGQLFITGKEDISEYVHSQDNTVMIAVDENNDVKSATYITQNQVPYTYNDITKYFKDGNEYQQYVKKSYDSEHEYKRDLLFIYKIKLEAFKEAKDRILEEHPEYNGDIMKYLYSEVSNPENKFHEKSELREKLNRYMSEYIANKNDDKYPNLKEKYEQFYWVTSDYMSQVFKKVIDSENPKIKLYESFMADEQNEYTRILRKSALTIYDKSNFDSEKYYGANTSNSVEIDTYITHPEQRSSGVARALVYEGIKKHIEKHFENKEHNDIYLCSTLHKENLSSKYVSEFFGLKDNLYVQRRHGRNREVHICKIDRKDANTYLEDIQDKLILLYGYNPTNKKLEPERKIDVLKNQFDYEIEEMYRLSSISKHKVSYVGGKLDGLCSKIENVRRIHKMIKECEKNKNRGDDYEPEL